LPVFKFQKLCYTSRVFSLPIINIIIPLIIYLSYGEFEPFSNNIAECRYICHALIITPRTYNIGKWIHNRGSRPNRVISWWSCKFEVHNRGSRPNWGQRYCFGTWPSFFLGTVGTHIVSSWPPPFVQPLDESIASGSFLPSSAGPHLYIAPFEHVYEINKTLVSVIYYLNSAKSYMRCWWYHLVHHVYVSA